MNAARKSLTIADIRMEMVAKFAAGAALFVVLASFIISFAQIKWVAEEMGMEPRILAWLFPFVIDLPSLVASALTVALHDRAFRIRVYAWCVLAVFIVLSWLCNAVHALSVMAEGKVDFVTRLATIFGTDSRSPALQILVLIFAGIPPVGVVIGMHIWAYALRHSSGADQRADGTVATRVAAAPKPLAKPGLIAGLKQKWGKQPVVTTADDAGKAGEKKDERKPAPKPEPVPAPAEEKPPARAEEIPARAADEPRALIEAVCAEMLAEMPEDRKEKPDAAEVRRRAGIPDDAKPVQQTVRTWVLAHWKRYDAARVQDDERAPEPMPTRTEVHLADPADAEMDDQASARRAVERVA